MTKSIDNGFGTASAFSPALTGNEGWTSLVPFHPADLRILSNGKPDESVLTHIPSPTDQPMTFRTKITSIPNIYAGTTVDADGRLPVVQGLRIYGELRQMWKETDNSDPDWLKYIPFRVGISVDVPSYSNVTLALVNGGILRAVMSLLWQPAANSPMRDRMANLLRGVVNPKDVS